MKTLLFCFFSALLSVSVAQPVVDAVTVTPNPFINRTSISYSITANDTVTIKVLNNIGQTVLTLFTNSVMTAGSYKDSLIMDAFPQGIYFVQVTLGVRKVIMAKFIKMLPDNVNEDPGMNALQVYPNPGNGTFFLKNSNAKVGKLTVTDLCGRNLLNEDLSVLPGETCSFTISGHGIFLLTLHLDDLKLTHKLFVP